MEQVIAGLDSSGLLDTGAFVAAPLGISALTILLTLFIAGRKFTWFSAKGRSCSFIHNWHTRCCKVWKRKSTQAMK